MKFHQNQKVICIAKSNEWTPTLNDAIRQVDLLIGNENVPLYNQVYTVNNPMFLFYNNTNFIELKEFPEAPISEKAFKDILSKSEYASKKEECYN